MNDKFQRMLNIPRDVLTWKFNPRLSIDEQESDELQADKVGFYAMVMAGYAPQAFAEILDRATQNEGYTGNILTDALETTDLVSMRVRKARKMNASLP